MSSPDSGPASEPDGGGLFSRRRLLGAAGVSAAVVGAAGAGALAGRASAADPQAAMNAAVP
ncbi:MAG TPA: deferrochelatase/peroxidase EfeB, partial [Mycobacterium sp.]|nr:deferrochelatase/peroxidase EfeB [Mycobacterium sp.]